MHHYCKRLLKIVLIVTMSLFNKTLTGDGLNEGQIKK